MSHSLISQDEVLRRLLRRLQHYYGKEYSPGKNIHTMMLAVAELIVDIGTEFKAIEVDWSVVSSTGDKLDTVSERYAVYRDSDETDDSLRFRLGTEVLIETSHGKVSEIKRILGRVFEIPPEEIAIYLNYSPSLGIDIETGIDSFMEIEVPLVYLEEGDEEAIFMFSDVADVSDFDDECGFDYGRLLFAPDSDMYIDIEELLDRIVGAGIGFTVSGRGGFMFSDVDGVPDLDDDDGFDAGMLSGIII